MNEPKRKVFRPAQRHAPVADATAPATKSEEISDPIKMTAPTAPAKDPYRDGMECCARNISELQSSLLKEVTQLIAGLDAADKRSAALLPLLDEVRRSGLAIARIAEADKEVQKASLEIKIMEIELRSRRGEVGLQELERQSIQKTGKQHVTTSFK